MDSSNETIMNEVFEEENPHTFVDFVWYMSLSCACLLFTVVIITLLKLWSTGHKRHSTQQRQTYTPDPSGYVSSTPTPPPNYESLAPPSYEEVMKKSSSHSQLNIQPIFQPITAALAKSLNTENSINGNSNKTNSDEKNSTSGNSIPNITDSSSIVITISSDA